MFVSIEVMENDGTVIIATCHPSTPPAIRHVFHPVQRKLVP